MATFPIVYSDIIYNKRNDLAIIVVLVGNNNGEIRLYKKQNDVWVFVENTNRWDY